MSVSVVVWLMRVRPFIENHGDVPSFIFFNFAPLNDYRKAREICKHYCFEKPRFLRVFEICYIMAAVFIIVGAVTTLVSD